MDDIDLVGVKILRTSVGRLDAPNLGLVSKTVSEAIDGGARHILLDLASVRTADSAFIGFLFDLYRVISRLSGRVSVINLSTELEALVCMTGLYNFVNVFSDESLALQYLAVPSKLSSNGTEEEEEES